MNTISCLLKSLRINRKITLRNLCRGLCSASMLSMIESGKTDPDIRLLRLLLERLGKSFNKLELIINKDTYSNELSQLEFERLIKHNRIIEARELLSRLRPDTLNHITSIKNMIYFRNLSVLEYLEGKTESAVSHMETAIKKTITSWSNNGFDEHAISSTEFENIILFLYFKYIDCPNPNHNDPTFINLLAQLEKHLQITLLDDEERAVIFPKLMFIAAKRDLLNNDFIGSVSKCDQALGLLRKHEILYLVPEFLEIIVQYGQTFSLSEPYENYVSYYTAIQIAANLCDYSTVPVTHLFLRCNKALYHLDSEVIEAERLMSGFTQEEFIENIYQEASSLSRIENFKTSMQTELLLMLLNKAQVNKGRVNTALICKSFDSLEMLREYDLLVLKGNSEKAKDLLEKVHSTTDLTISNNMQIYQLKYNMLDNSISNKEPSEIVQETRHYLQDHYPIETSDVFRPPFYEEICAITQLAINLRKVGKPDDSLKLYAKCYDCFYKSRIDHAFQYKSFGIIQSNYAIRSNDYEIALDDISYLFDVGSLSDLYLSVGIIGCKLYNKDKTNEHAKKVIKASSSLAMLTMRFEDARKMENMLNHL